MARPRAVREGGRVASAWAFSIVGHAVALGLGGLLVAASFGHKQAPPTAAALASSHDDEAFEIELPTVVDGSKLLNAPTPDFPSEATPRGGGETMARLDTGRPGKGGEDTSSTAAINLADRDDDLLLSPEVMSRLDRNQIQRIRASRRRATREDQRASREPMELTFLAEGKKGLDPRRPEHKKLAASDPSSGMHAMGAVVRKGGALGADPLAPGFGERPRQPGSPIEGAAEASVGRGARDTAPGEDHRDAALVAFARPMVSPGTPSVPADVRDRPTDNVDSEQEVATRMQSILHASNAGGLPGAGAGGELGLGPAGSGGVAGQGAAARALGTGQGPGLDNDPRDRRRNDYVRRVLAKLAPHTQWRKLMSVEAAAEGVQGVAIVSCTVLADGSVTAVSLTRSSGVAQLDANFRAAVVKAAPYPPLPAELGTTFRFAFPLDLRNPVVRPKDPTARRGDG